MALKDTFQSNTLIALCDACLKARTITTNIWHINVFAPSCFVYF